LASVDPTVNGLHRRLRHLAGGLIAASALAGLLAIGVRAGWGGWPARGLGVGTLFLAVAAYVAHVRGHQKAPASC
jgi:hypothetical protein